MGWSYQLTNQQTLKQEEQLERMEPGRRGFHQKTSFQLLNLQ